MPDTGMSGTGYCNLLNLLYTEWNLPHYILEESNFNVRYVCLWDLDIPVEKKAKLFANIGDPDQTPHSAAADLGLHCLPITRLGVSRLQWVNHDLRQTKMGSVHSSLVESPTSARVDSFMRSPCMLSINFMCGFRPPHTFCALSIHMPLCWRVRKLKQPGIAKSFTKVKWLAPRKRARYYYKCMMYAINIKQSYSYVLFRPFCPNTLGKYGSHHENMPI